MRCTILYHRQGFFSTFFHDTQYWTYGERDNSWEFPLLLKYKLRWLPVNPFVEAGVVPRTMTGRITGTLQADYGAGLTTPSPINFCPGAGGCDSNPASLSPSVGFVAGGGFQFNLGHLRLAPQARYTRWLAPQLSGMDGFILGGTYSSNLNQVDVLVGISWMLR
jgi:hypothetical protein